MQRAAAESILLLKRHTAQAMLFCGKSGGNARGTCSDHYDIVRRFCFAEFRNGIHRLASLFHGLSDQSHATELPGDVDAGHIGFEVGFQLRDVHSPGFGAENKLDRSDRAGVGACAMTYAKCRADEHALAVDDADRLFGTGFIAATRTEA